MMAAPVRRTMGVTTEDLFVTFVMNPAVQTALATNPVKEAAISVMSPTTPMILWKMTLGMILSLREEMIPMKTETPCGMRLSIRMICRMRLQWAATQEPAGKENMEVYRKSPMEVDGLEIIMARMGPTGANAGVEDGGPAEMGTPAAAAAAGIKSHDRTRYVAYGRWPAKRQRSQRTDRTRRNTVQKRRINLDSHLTVAMSDPMGSSPMVDGNGDGYHGGPVDPR